MKLIPKLGKRRRKEEAENESQCQQQPPTQSELFDTTRPGEDSRRRLLFNPFSREKPTARKQRRWSEQSPPTPDTERLLLDDYPGTNGGAPGQKMLAFDTYHSTVFEPIFRALLVAGLICFILVAAFAAYKINEWVSAGDGREAAEKQQSAHSVVGQRGSPAEGAVDLATGFARTYLATDPAHSPEDYAARLEPYLHPEADPALFTPTSPTLATTKVLYTSARSVERAGGPGRYRVIQDARTLTDTPSDEKEGGASSREAATAAPGRTTSEDLTLEVYVRSDGDGAASVVAPPTVSEAAPADAGSPGIFGGDDAESIPSPRLKADLEEFFESLYASRNLRPLVEEHMADGVTVERFPPEGYSYEGIQRAALYRQLDDPTPQAAGVAFEDLFRAEIYVRTTDAGGAQRLHSYVLTLGKKENGRWLITQVS